MAPEAVADALAPLEPLGLPLALAGSASGIAALFKSLATLQKTREFKAHMKRERFHNKESLVGILRGCRITIAKMLDMPDADMYYRSLAAVSHTLQGPLLRYEEYIAHDTRRLVPALLTQLLAASAVKHRRSTEMLRVASRHVGTLPKSINAPPPNPASGA